jgi:hypothetical protein
MFRGIPADATFRGVVYNPSELPKMIRGITRKKICIYISIYLPDMHYCTLGDPGHDK